MSFWKRLDRDQKIVLGLVFSLLVVSAAAVYFTSAGGVFDIRKRAAVEPADSCQGECFTTTASSCGEIGKISAPGDCFAGLAPENHLCCMDEPTPTLAGCRQGCTGNVDGVSCAAGLVCRDHAGERWCVNAECPDDSDCNCTPSPTDPPGSATCNDGCDKDNDCIVGFICYGIKSPINSPQGGNGICRNSSCVNDSDCSCATPSPTPSPTNTPTATATPIIGGGGSTATPTPSGSWGGSPTITKTPTPTKKSTLANSLTTSPTETTQEIEEMKQEEVMEVNKPKDGMSKLILAAIGSTILFLLIALTWFVWKRRKGNLEEETIK